MYELDLAEDLEQEDDTSGPLAALEPFFADGLISRVLYTVKSGKEATVYCCEAGPAAGVPLVAAKIYRPREHRNFRNDAVYQAGRSHGKHREQRACEKKTRFGREVQAMTWVYEEYETLQLLHGRGADVPRPLGYGSGALLMDYLGDAGEPAAPLQRVLLEPDEAHPLFARVMRNIELMLACRRVHGDLSPFNILYWEGRVTLIDFPQAVDATRNPHTYELLQRDIANVCRYFARYGVRADAARLAGGLWSRFILDEL
jgi:RIO kinase 1